MSDREFKIIESTPDGPEVFRVFRVEAADWDDAVEEWKEIAGPVTYTDAVEAIVAAHRQDEDGLAEANAERELRRQKRRQARGIK